MSAMPDPPTDGSDASPDVSSARSRRNPVLAPAPAFAAAPSAPLSASSEHDSQPQPQNDPPSTSLPENANPRNDNDESQQPRFTPEEETALLDESNTLKATANATFTAGDYSSAITHYDRALASCPTYLEYECAVLRSNIAACHLKLSHWKAAIDAATAALNGLERLLPGPKLKSRGADDAKKGEKGADPAANVDLLNPQDAGDGVVELEGNEAEVSAQLAKLQLSDQRRTDIARIRSKSLLRRARARSQIQTWAELQAAQDDYTLLATAFPDLPSADRRVVEGALRELPGRVKAAREREMGEMMGKLKELGNGLLKPFGLSTDMFKVQQGEGGGYSISVDQGK